MQNLQSLETGVLLEMLVKNTTEYRKMLGQDTDTKSFSDCEMKITLLESAINARLINKFNATAKKEPGFGHYSASSFSGNMALS
jgi:hypothetical protein